ncbi:MAG TPA: ABC transporter permease [Candidatus Onthocola gallistercoris]|uniref:ABC transporter permease n=1 Tax=Candidatus Onthocola gallistercoris TaxID=2840876 RepID=A0A9D1HGZ8_9FIRM|nr:ABC transporter permease [Candidatus Onthocola gallistercoris]
MAKNTKAVAAGNDVIKSRSQFGEVFHRLLKNKGAVIGMIFLLVLVIIALISPLAFDYETQVIGQNMADRLQGPSAAHWFGTDEFGRDLFARIMWGSRYSLIIGFGAVTIGLVVGTILGAIAGFKGGIWDQLIMRFIDIFYSIPNIMIAVVIVSVLGTSTVNLVIALSFSAATGFCRVVRAAVMTVRDQEYVESSYAMGLPTWKIIAKHILPNCLSPIIVQYTLQVGTTIISASSLSFLGIGVPAPAPEWGALLSGGRSRMRDASYLCVLPGLAILFTVLALNLLGDGLRDALDPKLKK